MSKKIIVVAPHPDDETLGCAGTLLRHKEMGDEIFWLVVTSMAKEYGFSEEEISNRNNEISNVSEEFGFQKHFILDYAPGGLDSIPLKNLIEAFGKIFEECTPDTVYFPFSNDIHTDHRVTSEAVLSCSKNFRYSYIRSLRAYEVISETEFGNNLYKETFHPNLWIDISEFLEQKIKIMNIYKSEIEEHPFPRSETNIKALASFRGSTIGTEYAESFISVKEIIK
jgi:LmbE family N-acetylglucosaminyl deacetylase